MKSEDWDAATLYEQVRSFWECRVFLSAVDLGVFPLLSEEILDAGEVARRLKADLRAMTVLLDALAAMGLLEKTADRYRVRENLIPSLSDESEESVLPVARHASNLWQRWTLLTQIVKTGEPASPPSWEERPEEETRAFIGAMHAFGRRAAVDFLSSIDIGGARRFLDIAGASGTYTIAILRAEPEMTATLFDLPAVIPLAHERLNREGLLNRVTLAAGDYNVDELPGGHDLSLLSAIIHQNSREQNRLLYCKAYASLVSGGRLLIRDEIMEPGRTRPRSGALFAVNMVVATEGGGTYTFDEIREDLKEAGFTRIRQIRQQDRMGGIVEARRP